MENGCYGIPLSGWKYIGVIDVGESAPLYSDIKFEVCQMCGKERIRYVHLLSHPDYDGIMRVGVICAGKMMEGPGDPLECERGLINKLERKETFMSQPWSYNPEKQTYTLRFKGECITIKQSHYGNFGICFQDKWYWHDRKRRSIGSLDLAKRDAFEVFDKFHKKVVRVNPFGP